MLLWSIASVCTEDMNGHTFYSPAKSLRTCLAAAWMMTVQAAGQLLLVRMIWSLRRLVSTSERLNCIDGRRESRDVLNSIQVS